MDNFEFHPNDKVIVLGKATIAVVTACYTVESWRFYSLNKYPGFLVREDCLTTWEGLKQNEEETT